MKANYTDDTHTTFQTLGAVTTRVFEELKRRRSQQGGIKESAPPAWPANAARTAPEGAGCGKTARIKSPPHLRGGSSSSPYALGEQR